MLDPHNLASLGLSISTCLTGSVTALRPESITAVRFNLAGDLFAFIIRLIERLSRSNETEYARNCFEES